MIVGNFADWSVGNVTLVASAVSNTQTITLPAGIQAGDFIVLGDTAFQTGLTPPTPVYPAGYTLVAQDAEVRDNSLFTDFAFRSIFHMKIGSPADSGAVVTGMLGTSGTPNFMGKIALVFRAAGGVGSVATSPQINMSNGDLPAQVVPAGLERSIVVAMYAGSTTTTLYLPTFSPAQDGDVDSSNVLRASYKIFNGPGVPVTTDIADIGFAQAATLFTCRFDLSL